MKDQERNTLTGEVQPPAPLASDADDAPPASEAPVPSDEMTAENRATVENQRSSENEVPSPEHEEAAPAPNTPSEEESASENANDTPEDDALLEEQPRPLSVKPIAMADSLRTEVSVNSMMLDVLVALVPILAWAVYLFGLRPLTLTGLSVATCYLTELLCHLLFRRKEPIDLAPAVTGVILALGMPATVPLWLPPLGAGIAILFIRQLFGGTGRNRLNPAATALAILYILFPQLMTAFCPVGVRLPALSLTAGPYEAIGPSALETLLSQTLPSQSLGSMFVGLRPGLIGETSALLLLAGGLYLVIRKILRPGLPLAFAATVALLTYSFPTLRAVTDVTALRYAGYHLLCGELLLGAIFMASDPVTSPRSGRAALVAGVIGGAVTVAVRYFVSPYIGVICAVLVINLLSRPLDYLLRPSLFGGRPKKKS